MKINALLKASTAFLLLFLLAVSCQKETITPEQTIRLQPETIELSAEFYQDDYLTSVNPHTLALADAHTTIPAGVKSAFKAMDKRENYSANMIKNYGYPIWNRTYAVQDNEGQPLYFTPLAYEKGTSSSSFLLSVPNEGNHLFRHIKKANLKQELEIATATISNETRLFVNFFLTADGDIFDNVDKELVGWLKMNKNGYSEEKIAIPRNCTSVTVCDLQVFRTNEHGTSRACVILIICVGNTTGPGGTGGSCQECPSGGGGYGGSGGGGSSGGSSNSSGEADPNEYNPCWDSNCPTETYSMEEWPMLFKAEDGTYIYAPTCPSSFDLKTVQETYTFQVDKIWHSYLAVPGGFADYRIGSMCVNIPRRKASGQIRSKVETANGLASAFDFARIKTIQFYESGYANKRNLRNTYMDLLKKVIPGYIDMPNGGNITINPVPCQNIEGKDLLIKPFSSCKSYW